MGWWNMWHGYSAFTGVDGLKKRDIYLWHGSGNDISFERDKSWSMIGALIVLVWYGLVVCQMQSCIFFWRMARQNRL